MPSKPRIFISAVSSEFRQLRQLTAQVLLRLGYDPVWQDIMGTGGGDLRRVLTEKIDSCQGVLQIVGAGYGWEPETVDPEFGRLSYTQFELAHAQKIGKKTWVVFADEGCTRDSPVESLDLPEDPDHPDPVGYQAERRALQEAWSDRLKQTGHLHHGAASDTELELRIERLKDDMAELLRGERVWRRAILAALAAIAILAVVAVVMITNIEPGEGDSSIPFSEIGKEDLRPELSFFDAGASVAGYGLGWSVRIDPAPDATKALQHTGTKVFYSLDGENYTEGMTAGWIKVNNAMGCDRIFLRFRSFDGEEIGPFEYPLDFEGYAVEKYRKELEDRSDWIMARHTVGDWFWQYNLGMYLSPVERIEYGFDPDLSEKKTIDIPGADFADYFKETWKSSLAFMRRAITPPNDESKILYYRFVYRGGDIGATKSSELTAPPSRPFFSQPGSTISTVAFDEIERDDLKVSLFEFSAQRSTGWRVRVTFPPGVTMKLRDPKNGVLMRYSLDGERYTEADSEMIRIDDFKAAKSGRLSLKLESQSGESVGPFEYKIDFYEAALLHLKKEARENSFQQVYKIFSPVPASDACRFQSTFWNPYLATIKRIEYGYDRALEDPEKIPVPEAEFADYFDFNWLRENWQLIDIQPPADAETLYCRIVFTDESTSALQEVPLRSNTSTPSAGGGGFSLGGGGGGGVMITPPVAPPPPR